MAKSLRARSKVQARNAKRYNAKSDYAVVQAARLAQTSGRLADKNKHGKTLAEEEADAAEGTEDDEKMADEAGEEAKATTENQGWYPLIASGKEEGGVGSSDDALWALFGLCDAEDLSTDAPVAKAMERLLASS